MTRFSNKKIAIFYDWLYTWGGAERLLLNLLKVFPKADIFTSYYNPTKTKWLPSNIRVHQLKIPIFFEDKLSLLSPFIPAFLEKYNFDKYQTLISMGTIFNNCLITKPSTRYISYTLTPNRYLDKLSFYKPIDKIFSSRPDQIITISKTVAKRIQDRYNRKSKIIYPPVDTTFFTPISNSKSSYYLVVSRLVPHKNIDQPIKSCLFLNKKLIIIGSGRQEKYLKSIAKSKYIKFIKNIDDIQLKSYYQNCKALLSPQIEDFGLSNIECLACGKPVIGFNLGGNTETILHKKTGFLYSDNLTNAILEFEKLNFLTQDCVNQAKKFSFKKFMLDWKHNLDETD